MSVRHLRLLLAVAALALTPACSFYSVATHWNGRVGADGHPIHVATVTNLGINFGIVVPFIGKTTIDEMIDEITADIASRGGDHIRVFETAAENYWYGLAPLTWIATPVITDVSVEYRPSAAEIEEARARDAAAKERARQRNNRDNSHIVPGTKADLPAGAPVTDPGRLGGKIKKSVPDRLPDELP